MKFYVVKQACVHDIRAAVYYKMKKTLTNTDFRWWLIEIDMYEKICAAYISTILSLFLWIHRQFLCLAASSESLLNFWNFAKKHVRRREGHKTMFVNDEILITILFCRNSDYQVYFLVLKMGGEFYYWHFLITLIFKELFFAQL